MSGRSKNQSCLDGLMCMSAGQKKRIKNENFPGTREHFWFQRKFLVPGNCSSTVPEKCSLYYTRSFFMYRVVVPQKIVFKCFYQWGQKCEPETL